MEVMRVRAAGRFSPRLARTFVAAVFALTCGVVAAEPSVAPVGYPVDPLVPNATPPNALSVTPPAILDQATVTLAPGDSVTMTVFGRPELTLTGYVSDSGTIDVPLAGSIPVAGLSPTQAAERVATAYREGEYLIDPQVNIVLAAIRSQQISVVGEVVRPGRFPMDTRTTILDALAQAGGISPLGAERAFILRRSMDGVERFEVDLQDLLSAGSGQVVQIRAGDTIVIPKAPLFYIYGEVSRPGAFPLRSKITVIEAISIAGGLTPRGSSRRIEIKRRLKDGKSQRSDAEIDDEVMAEDVINVKERLF
ncbi:polysaccharide export outer membrane protein [Panacagrimonas perspica]|uniref:Polysaccharide export outer membrane protein n=1 Tax=Panacagrimonas perspica TaxID=381431 RepID=A0A4R7PFY7_9GAMM|nr:polysaccharide export outer membrane protein [Panacagrimonas perspica]